MELPRRLAHRAREMRSGGTLLELNAILDAVAGNGLARNQAIPFGRHVPREIAIELGIRRLARPFGGVERLAMRTVADLFRIALAPRPGTSLGQIAHVRGGHFVLAHLD